MFKSTHFGINGSFWSIAVEIQLYLIYPLLIFITNNIGWRKGIISVGLIETSIRLLDSLSNLNPSFELPHFIRYSPFTFWLSWAIGAYVAQCFLESRASGLSKVRFDTIIAVAFFLKFFKPCEGFSFLMFSIAAAIAIDRLISNKWSPPKGIIMGLAWRHLSFLGVVSYSFYLFHQPIVNFISKPLTHHPRIAHSLENIVPGIDLQHLQPSNSFIICIAIYPFILGLSYLVFQAVEQPGVKLGKSLAARYSKKKLSGPEQN